MRLELELKLKLGWFGSPGHKGDTWQYPQNVKLKKTFPYICCCFIVVGVFINNYLFLINCCLKIMAYDDETPETDGGAFRINGLQLPNKAM